MSRDDETVQRLAGELDKSPNEIRRALRNLEQKGLIVPLTSPRPSGEIERLREALTPSGDTKAAYMGEFSFHLTHVDEFGDDRQVKVYVPWDTIKEIMAAIRARAALSTGSNSPSLGEIRAQAFEEAAKVADNFRLPGGGISAWVRTNESFAEAQRRLIAKAIRALSGQSGEALGQHD